MIINILSGDVMGQYADKLGFADKVIPFGESMITGHPTGDIFSKEFIAERAASLKTTPEKYRKKIVFPLSKLRSTDEVHVWFGRDMYCQINLITVLALLEKNGIKSAVFHEVFEDDMVEKSKTEISTEGFSDAYNSILVSREPTVTGLDTVNSAIELYFEFINADGPLCDFIKENKDDSVLTLTLKIIRSYAEYGLGDVACKDLILRVREKQNIGAKDLSDGEAQA